MEDSSWLTSSDTIGYIKYPLKFDILFYLSSGGSVDSISYSPERMSSFVRSLDKALKRIKFYSAKFSDTLIPFILPGELIFETTKGSRAVKLLLPFEEQNCDRINHLAEKALRLNGFVLPNIKRFPSYFCSFKGESKNENYPFAIFQIWLDSAGAVTDWQQIYTGRPDLSSLISNALLYADYEPASCKGRAFASTFYVVFRFFRNIDYPTAVWPPSSEPIPISPFDYYRIGQMVLLDSVVNPPYPLNVPGGIFRDLVPIPFHDTLNVYVTIDTSGRIDSLRSFPMIPGKKAKALESALKKIRFTSAINISGLKVPFAGELSVVVNDSKKIRISVEWLPEEAQIQRE